MYNAMYSMPSDYGIQTITHVFPIMVYLTDWEWEEFQNYYPNVLSVTCHRYRMDSENERTYSLCETTEFGDAMRWLFKLKGPEVEVISNLK